MYILTIPQRIIVRIGYLDVPKTVSNISVKKIAKKIIKVLYDIFYFLLM